MVSDNPDACSDHPVTDILNRRIRSVPLVFSVPIYFVRAHAICHAPSENSLTSPLFGNLIGGDVWSWIS